MRTGKKQKRMLSLVSSLAGSRSANNLSQVASPGLGQGIKPRLLFGEIYNYRPIATKKLIGIQSGSHIANNEVRKILVRSLDKFSSQRVQVKHSDLAELLQAFDSMKRGTQFDWKVFYDGEPGDTLKPGTNGVQFWVDLLPEQVQWMFGNAYNAGFKNCAQGIQAPYKNSRSDSC